MVFDLLGSEPQENSEGGPELPRHDESTSDGSGRVFSSKDGHGRSFHTHSESENETGGQERYKMPKKRRKFRSMPGSSLNSDVRENVLTAPRFSETGRNGGSDQAEGGEEDDVPSTEVKVERVRDPTSTTLPPRDPCQSGYM